MPVRSTNRGRARATRAASYYAPPGMVGLWNLDETSGNVGSNLVTNPGFETYTTSPGAPDNWTAVNSGAGVTSAKNTSNPHTGSNAYSVTVDWTVASLSSHGVLQNMSVTAGLSYYFEGWYFLAGALSSGTAAYLKARNATDSVDVVTLTGTLVVGAWTKFSGTFTAVAGKSYRVECGLFKGSGATGTDVVLFDDIVFQQIQATDRSTQANPGTWVGGTNTAGPTPAAAGASFDGVDDTISVPNSSALQVSTAFTLEGRVKPSTIAAGLADIVTKPASYAFRRNAATIVWSFPGLSTSTAATGSVLSAGVEAHVAVTYDGSNAILYVNGLAVVTTPTTGNAVQNGNALAIGSNGTSANFWTGSLRRVRVYNRALSATEVARRYRSQR